MDKYLNIAIKAAKAAEEIILKDYKNNNQYREKTDGSPVTKTDTDTEQIIKQVIGNEFPEHGFWGEEEGRSKVEKDFVWIIDPIDGTKNFIRGIPLFGTEIALMYKREVILGLSNAPVMKELIYAVKGDGAYLNGKRVTVSKIDSIDKAFVSYGSLGYFQKINKLDNLLSLDDQTQGHRCFGDCFAYHLLAQGKIDIVIEGSVKIWDIAAVSLIVEEAGGRVTDMVGRGINLHSDNIIATNGLLHKKVLEMMKGK